MKKLDLWKVLQSMGILFFIGACIMFAINTFAVLAASFGFFRPFSYLQYVRAPYWAVLLPAAGILLFFPLALRLAFMRESPEAKMKPAERVDFRHAIEGLRSKFRLRPV
jgi:formate hydrogenlyase subunit 3/multisubunit Na+/H+ antiporter MnhD subunit